MKKIEDKYYYLFGGEVSAIYYSSGLDELVDYIIASFRPSSTNSIDWHLYEYDSVKGNPSELLSEFCGWENFAEISKVEFDILSELMDNMTNF